MKAITSTYHLNMMFRMEDRVGVVREDQYEARKCHAIAIKEKNNQAMHIASEDGNEVVNETHSLGERMPIVEELIGSTY